MRPDHRYRLVRRPLTVVVAVVALLPLVLMVFFTVQVTDRAVRGQAELRLSASAEASAVAVEQQLVGLREVVAAFADRPSLASVLDPVEETVRDTESRQAHLDSLLSARPGIEVVFILDASGVLIDAAPSSPELVGSDFSDQDWYVGAVQSRGPYVSGIYPTPALDRDLVVAAAALIRSGRDDAVPIEGVLVAAYSQTAVQGFIDEFAEAQGVEITVVDQHDVVVATGGHEQIGQQFRDGESHAIDLAGHPGPVAEPREDGTALVAYEAAEAIGWTITAELPLDAALEETQALRSAIITVAALLALMVLTGVVLVDRSVRRRD